MCVGYQNMCDGFVGDCSEQGGNVLTDVWPRVNDGNFAAADDISPRTVKRERTGIARNDPPNQRRQVRRFAVGEFEGVIESGLLRHAQFLRTNRSAAMSVWVRPSSDTGLGKRGITIWGSCQR